MAEVQAEALQRKPSLLVADDEEAIRLRLREMGAALGFEAHAARDGAEAWTLYQELQPDLVVLDIYMPRMNGLMVLQKIKETRPQCKVVLITGFMNYVQLVQNLDNKPDGFLTKPFSLTAVADTLVRLARNAGLGLQPAGGDESSSAP